MKLKEDMDRLGCWARSLGMRFKPVRCSIMQITRKRIKKMSASYTSGPLAFRRRNLAACSQNVKMLAYKGLMRRVLKYGSSVLDFQSILFQYILPKYTSEVSEKGSYIRNRQLHILKLRV